MMVELKTGNVYKLVDEKQLLCPFMQRYFREEREECFAHVIQFISGSSEAASSSSRKILVMVDPEKKK